MINLGIVQSPSLISLDSPGISSSTSGNNGGSTNDFDSTYEPPKEMNESKEIDGAVQNEEHMTSSISNEEGTIPVYGVKVPDELSLSRTLGSFSGCFKSNNRP